MVDILSLIVSPYTEHKEKLYKELHRHVLSKAKRMTYNQQDAEDLSQEVMIKFYQKFQVTEEITRGSILKFLNLTTFTTAIDMRRKVGRCIEGGERISDELLLGQGYGLL